MIVANLLKKAGRQSSIRFEEIQTSPPSPDCHADSTVALYKICVNPNAGTTSDNHLALRSGSGKALLKGWKAAALLVRLLNYCPSRRGQSRKKTIQSGCVPTVIVGEGVIVADETFSDAHKPDAHSWNLFFATEFFFPNALVDGQLGLRSTQYLQTSSPTIKFEDSIFKDTNAAAFDSINIISGVCIFSGDILKTSICRPDSGKFDFEKLLQTGPTFHEMEYISRSSAAIADVLGLLVSRFCGDRVQVPVCIGLDIPSFHYYHSATTAFANSVCTAEEAFHWIEAVDLRHDQIAHVFATSVRHQLRRRGVDPAHYEIRVSSKANPMASSLKADLQNRRISSLDSVLQLLDKEESETWKRFYQLIPAKERPKDFRDLGYLFYVFFILKLACMSDLAPECQPPRGAAVDEGPAAPKMRVDSPLHAPKREPKPRRLIVSIDDPAERRIYSRSQELMRKLRQSPENPTDSALVEVYMCRRVLVNGNRTRARLYHDDPMPEVPSLSYLPECSNRGGPPVTPLDVVGRLYGLDCAEDLQSWFAEVGLHP